MGEVVPFIGVTRVRQPGLPAESFSTQEKAGTAISSMLHLLAGTALTVGSSYLTLTNKNTDIKVRVFWSSRLLELEKMLLKEGVFYELIFADDPRDKKLRVADRDKLADAIRIHIRPVDAAIVKLPS